MNIVELIEQIEHAQEALGETVSQHRAETAMYGDSWPGAQLQIADMRRDLSALLAQMPPDQTPALPPFSPDLVPF